MAGAGGHRTRCVVGDQGQWSRNKLQSVRKSDPSTSGLGLSGAGLHSGRRSWDGYRMVNDGVFLSVFQSLDGDGVG